VYAMWPNDNDFLKTLSHIVSLDGKDKRNRPTQC
jgi:hypothetical protein